jgi:hypothetical protein
MADEVLGSLVASVRHEITARVTAHWSRGWILIRGGCVDSVTRPTLLSGRAESPDLLCVGVAMPLSAWGLPAIAATLIAVSGFVLKRGRAST